MGESENCSSASAASQLGIRISRFGVSVSKLGRGYSYADGTGGYGWVTTILPPNSPSCAIESTPLYEGVFSVASRHPGGAHIVLGDGAVIFITDTIDCGDPRQAPPSGLKVASPYGIWGALGTRESGEDLEEQTID